MLEFAAEDASTQQGREEDKAFRGGNQAERLIGIETGVRRQVRQRHPDEQQTAQTIQLRLSLGFLRGFLQGGSARLDEDGFTGGGEGLSQWSPKPAAEQSPLLYGWTRNAPGSVLNAEILGNVT